MGTSGAGERGTPQCSLGPVPPLGGRGDPPMRRVSVVGSPGAGKSTLGAALAARLGGPWIELDALNHQPGWVPRERDAQRGRARRPVRWAALGGRRQLLHGLANSEPVNPFVLGGGKPPHRAPKGAPPRHPRAEAAAVWSGTERVQHIGCAELRLARPRPRVGRRRHRGVARSAEPGGRPPADRPNAPARSHPTGALERQPGATAAGARPPPRAQRRPVVDHPAPGPSAPRARGHDRPSVGSLALGVAGRRRRGSRVARPSAGLGPPTARWGRRPGARST